MDTLTKIRTCAVELFRQFGFKSVTMDDVARRAGLSKKTLYQHFDNKDKVVSDTIVWYKCKISDSCKSMLGSSGNAVEAFVKIQQMLDEAHKDVNPLLIFELQRFYPEGYLQFRRNLEQDAQQIKDNILQGIKEGNYRADIDADLLSKFHIETAMLVLHPNMMVKDRYDIQHVNKAITEHFLYGIMTPKGEKLYRKYKEKYLK
jgi:TetR/AcrR family transcriptional regulator, cholesterol catabolism regulator